MSNEGARAEGLAAAFLARQGLTLVEQNYRCRFGEIDLILRDGEILVFVEVRLRANPNFGGAAASITPAKRARLLKAARHYLARLDRIPPCRFDAVLLNDAAGRSLEWLQNAIQE